MHKEKKYQFWKQIEETFLCTSRSLIEKKVFHFP